MSADEELALYIDNDGDLYQRYTRPIYQTLAEAKELGTYSRTLAVDKFVRLAEVGAKKYQKDVEPRRFTATEKRDFAVSAAEYFETEWNLGNLREFASGAANVNPTAGIPMLGCAAGAAHNPYEVRSASGLEGVFADRDDAEGYAQEIRESGAMNVTVEHRRRVGPPRRPMGATANPSDRELAARSLREEEEAVAAYGRRGAEAHSPKLREAFAHARREEQQHAAMFRKFTNPSDRLFIGVYPAGIVYADRAHEVDGDYKRVAFLPFSTLELEWEPGETGSTLRGEIEGDAARVAAMRGQEYPISATGQTVILGNPTRGALENVFLKQEPNGWHIEAEFEHETLNYGPFDSKDRAMAMREAVIESSLQRNPPFVLPVPGQRIRSWDYGEGELIRICEEGRNGEYTAYIRLSRGGRQVSVPLMRTEYDLSPRKALERRTGFTRHEEFIGPQPERLPKGTPMEFDDTSMESATVHSLNPAGTRVLREPWGDGSEIVIKRERYGISGWLESKRGGGRLPISFGAAHPETLREAMELAKKFLRSVYGKSNPAGLTAKGERKR